MLMLEKPTVSVTSVSEDGFNGVFTMEPLLPGVGLAIGNAMRRILLSSLPGIAVTHVRIDGVNHEFSYVPGVKEDVTEIVMNVKNIHLKDNGSSAEPRIAYLEYEGEGIVRAGDIKVDPEITIVNPEQVVATLSGSNSRLFMVLTIGKGNRFVPAAMNKVKSQTLDTISIDSIFSPVKNVNLNVETIREGEYAGYERLILDVASKGTVDLCEAVSMAAQIFKTHLQFFEHINDQSMEETEKTKEIENYGALLMTDIEELDLSVRAHNALRRSGVVTIGKLIAMTLPELMQIQNLGEKSKTEITNKLHEMGLFFKNEKREVNVEKTEDNIE